MKLDRWKVATTSGGRESSKMSQQEIRKQKFQQIHLSQYKGHQLGYHVNHYSTYQL